MPCQLLFCMEQLPFSHQHTHCLKHPNSVSSSHYPCFFILCYLPGVFMAIYFAYRTPPPPVPYIFLLPTALLCCCCKTRYAKSMVFGLGIFLYTISIRHLAVNPIQLRWLIRPHFQMVLLWTSSSLTVQDTVTKYGFGCLHLFSWQQDQNFLTCLL